MAAPLPPSGLPTVDARWGGLAAGSSTLLIGRAAAGRSALALQSAAAAVEAGGKALLISPRAPEALVEIATSVGFDLRAAHATGRFRVLRIPAAADLAARGSDGLDAAYRDLAARVTADAPDRVVVEDLTPLVQFETFDRFRAAFSGLVDALRAAGVTLVVGLGEPANDASEHLLGVVRDLVDGTATIETDGATRRLVLSRRDEAIASSQESSQPPTPEAATPEAPAGQSSDGASVETSPPVPTPLSAPPAAAPPPVAPEPAAEASVTEAPPQRRATGGTPASDGLPRTRIVTPPDPDPSLLEPVHDPFGHDPAASMFEQGYLVDSGASGVIGHLPHSGLSSQAPAVAPPAALPPAALAPAAPAPAAPAPAAPAFAPLGRAAPSAPPDPAAEVRQALDAAFAARASGTPFLVVAARMDPASAEGAHFFAVADGLRRALRPEDRLLVDLPRRRAVVVLPGVGAEGAAALFARLQGHLRASLGAEAEPVLQAVAAVSVPDGQPFTSTQDLLAYAYES